MYVLIHLLSTFFGNINYCYCSYSIFNSNSAFLLQRPDQDILLLFVLIHFNAFVRLLKFVLSSWLWTERYHRYPPLKVRNRYCYCYSSPQHGDEGFTTIWLCIPVCDIHVRTVSCFFLQHLYNRRPFSNDLKKTSPKEIPLFVATRWAMSPIHSGKLSEWFNDWQGESVSTNRRSKGIDSRALIWRESKVRTNPEIPK